MEAQKLLDAAPFEPHIVRLLKQVFDEAWASIAHTITMDRIGDMRLGLAHAIIAHAASGERDFTGLKVAALLAVLTHPRQANE